MINRNKHIANRFSNGEPLSGAVKFRRTFLSTCIVLIILCNPFAMNDAFAQFPYTNGFEGGDPAMIYDGVQVPYNATSNPRTGTNHGMVDGGCTGGSSGCIDGSIITGTTLSFDATKFYEVKVWARTNSCVGKLQIMKSVTATNAAMLAATGNDIILLSGSNNVTLTSYSEYTATFTVPSNETKYVGFQLFAAGAGGCSGRFLAIDDITITEYDNPSCGFYCSAVGTSDIPGWVKTVTFSGISRTSGFDGYYCGSETGTVSLSTNYTLTIVTRDDFGGGPDIHTLAWIDYNADGDYDDAGENVAVDATNSGTSVGDYTRNISVTIPGSATVGNTKMRVMFIDKAGPANGCGDYTYEDVEDYNITIESAAPSTLTLYNTGSASQLAFNNSYINDNTPLFRASAVMAGGFNRFFIEINTLSDFTGTAYTQTFSGAYASGTQYNLDCNALSSALPTTADVTYYVRVKASDDAGTSWGNWSSGTWSFTYKSAGNPDWFQTTTAQFNSDATAGVSVSSNSVTKTSGGTFYINDNFDSYADNAAFEAVWTVTESDADNQANLTTAQSVSGTQSINLLCTNAGGGGKQGQMLQTFAAIGGAATAECNARADGGWLNAIMLEEAGTFKAQILFYPSDGSISYYNGTLYTLVAGYTFNQWYNIKIDFNAGANTCEVFVDGVSLFSGTLGNSGFTTVDTYISSTDNTTLLDGYVDDVKVYTGSPDGTVTSTTINYASFIGVSSWCEASWTEVGGTGTFTVTVQENSAGWADVPGMVDIDVSPIDLTSLGTEAEIRLVGTFTYSGGAPTLTDWTVTAGTCGASAGNAYGAYAEDAVAGGSVVDCEISATGGTGGDGFLVSSAGADDAYTSVAISGYPVITVDNTACTTVNIDYVKTVGGNWTDLGTGYTISLPDATNTITSQYTVTSTGYKDIVMDGNTYEDFLNIQMDAPSEGTIAGTTTGCPETYNFVSSEAGKPGVTFLWTVVDPCVEGYVIATSTASSTDITFTNTSGVTCTFTVNCAISTECCGLLATLATTNIDIYITPAAPGVLEAAPTPCIGISYDLEVSPVTAGYNYNWYTGSCGGTSEGSGSIYTVSSVVDAATTYYVSAISDNGCSSTTCNTVVIDGQDTPPTVDNPSQCAAGGITITVTNPVSGATYNWYSDVGLTILLQSSTAITYVATVADGTTETVYVTVTETGCSASTGTTATATSTGNTQAVITWIGAVNNNWFDKDNWYPDCVPGCTDIVRIDAEYAPCGPCTTPPNFPIIAWADGGVACAGQIRIQFGASLTMLAGDNKAVLEVNSDWKLCGTFAANTGMVRFTGSTAQSIEGTQTTEFYTLVINNTSSTGVTLNKSIVVTGALNLIDGILFTDATNLLTLNNGATSTSGSFASFVDGPMKKIGIDAFVFPLGDGTIWARLGISAPSNPPTEYTAQYFSTAYTNTTSFAVGPPTINNVSVIEYWTLSRPIADDVLLTLYWEDNNFSGINQCDGTDLRIAHWSGTAWEITVDVVNITGGCPAAGTVQTNTVQTSYSPFAFASKSAAVNPLPIKLLYFDAQPNVDKVDLAWATASETNNDYFTIERSTDATDFDIVVKVPGAGTSIHTLYYSAVDEDPYYGISYYRLKQTDYDGRYEYSELVAVKFLKKLNFSVRPNPAHDYLEVVFGEVSKNIIFVMTPEYDASINIYDAQGGLVYKKEFNGTFYKFNIDISSFSTGMYFVSLTANNELYKAKFVKE